MATRLKNILNFTAGAGLTTVPHGLNWQGLGVRPDHIEFGESGFVFVEADATNITIENNGGPAPVSMLVESWHSIERAFGDVATLALSPQPFVVVSSSNPAPPFPSPETVVTIYANMTGNDMTGKGTAAKPYRTLQRALRDVPHVINPGVIYYVDVTNLGTGVDREILPPDYQFPVVKTSYNFELLFGSDPDFWVQCGFNVVARPRLVPGLGAEGVLLAADYTVSADPDTNLTILTLTGAPRPGWLADAMRGKLITGAFPLGDQAIIGKSTDTQLFLAASGFQFGDLLIKEPSAELETSNFATSQGINIMECSSISLQGLKITNPGGGIPLFMVECPEPFVIACDISPGAAFGPGDFYGVFGNWIHDGTLFAGADLFFTSGYYSDIVSWSPPNKSIEAGGMLWQRSVAIGPRRNAFGYPATFDGFGLELYLQNTLVEDSIADSDGTPGYGVIGGFGVGNMSFVQINGAQVDGILATSNGTMDIEHVTGSGNGGVGLRDLTGQVRVRDDATVITGVNGETRIGVLGELSWADFRALPPEKNRYDNTSPAVGNVETLVGGGVTGASNTDPIVITTAVAHGLETGDRVTIAGVGGNDAANGTFVVVVTGLTTFELIGSDGSFSGAYTAGGTVALNTGGTSGARLFQLA
jgi:hypothetical protein